MINSRKSRVEKLENDQKGAQASIWIEDEEGKSIWADSELHRARDGETMNGLYERLCREKGRRPFLMTQLDMSVL